MLVKDKKVSVTEMSVHKSQFRKHLKFGFVHRIRFLYYRSKLGYCGKQVYFDRNIRFLRFLCNIFIEDHVVIKEGAQICTCNHTAQISIGKFTTVGYYVFIFASENITIGNNCLIAPFVYLVDSNHGIQRDQLINQQPNLTSPIVIGNDVWLATGAKILKGVKIGDGAVIAAGALVKDDVSPYTIVGGIPARVLGERA